MKTLSTTLYLALAVLFFSACHSNKRLRESIAYKNRDKTWEDFRHNFLYNIQVVGVEKFQEDKSFNIIVSEPPESFDTLAFKDLVSGNSGAYEIRKHGIGVDGWVKDILISMNDVDDIDGFVKKLNVLLYGSDYKSYYINLPLTARPALYLSQNQNLNITAVELKNWLIDSDELFSPPGAASETYTLSGLNRQMRTGIFYSVKDGFVVWAIPIGGDISNKNDEIRQFTLDTDLLLGALTIKNTLFIVGRERQNNVIDMPPLRVETIQLLAHANKGELAQSYERTSFGAGKLPGGKDWAPIYLSDELKNTEYGSLLNITDQMLKSWSENGFVTYTNFKVVKPDYWAFNNGVHKDLNTEDLTYNWNTKGAVYEVKDSDYNVIALSHTGSLPVSYIPGGESEGNYDPMVVKAEAGAYNYFSNLNNPYLIRVNQYAALYQIFSNYGVTSNISVASSLSTPTADSTIADTSAAAFSSTAAITDNVAIAECAKSVFKQIINEDENGLQNKLEKLFGRAALRVPPGITLVVNSIKDSLKEINNTWGDEGLSKLANYLVNPRSIPDSVSVADSQIIGVSSFITKYQDLITGIYLQDKSGLYTNYLSTNNSRSGSWVKTPTAVLSWLNNGDSVRATGGHNIDSRIVPLSVDRSLEKGTYKIVEENGVKKILVAEGDMGRISPAFLRSVEDSKQRGLLTMPHNDDNTIPRLREDVVAATPRKVRGLSPEQITVVKSGKGYIVNNKPVSNCNEMIDELVNYAKKEKPDRLSITFKNTTADQANVIVRSTDIKLSTDGVIDAGNIFRVTGHKYDFERMTIAETENGVEVTIPTKQFVSEASMGIGCTTQSAKIGVKNLFGGLKERAKSVITALRAKVLKEKVPGSIDFYRQLKNEMIKNGVNESDIYMERQDCIICKLNPIKLYDYYQGYQAA